MWIMSSSIQRWLMLWMNSCLGCNPSGWWHLLVCPMWISMTWWFTWMLMLSSLDLWMNYSIVMLMSLVFGTIIVLVKQDLMVALQSIILNPGETMNLFLSRVSSMPDWLLPMDLSSGMTGTHWTPRQHGLSERSILVSLVWVMRMTHSISCSIGTSIILRWLMLLVLMYHMVFVVAGVTILTIIGKVGRKFT